MILIALFAHALGDYPLQGNFLAQGKNDSKYLLLMHCIIYTGVVVLLFYAVFDFYALWFVALIFIPHVSTDFAKTKNLISFRVDQAIHIATLLLAVMLIRGML